MNDLDDLALIYRDPDVRRYFPEGTLSYEETREELEWIIDVYYDRFGFGLWATIYLIDPANRASAGVAENISMTLERDMELDAEPTSLYSISSERALELRRSRAPARDTYGIND